MRKGWISSNNRRSEKYNAIVVDNNNCKNIVENYLINYSNIRNFLDVNTIGVWKIKKLN